MCLFPSLPCHNLSVLTHPLPTLPAGTLSPLLSIIVSVIASNACAVLLGTEGVYESELEAELHLNYLAQVGEGRASCLPATP